MTSVLDRNGRPMPPQPEEEDRSHLLDPEKNPNAVLDTAIAIVKESWYRYWFCMRRRPLRTIVLSWMMFAFVVMMRSCVSGTAESFTSNAEPISFDSIDPSNPTEIGAFLGASVVAPGTRTGGTVLVSAIAGGNRLNKAQLAAYKRRQRIPTQLVRNKKRERTTLVRY